ncbi:UNKNOWN [Stylonychia lemnae]|uniref:Uncharacterized protein n=1 Tax=Stylonychia lemnae TaxID=5949 RepID=A0A077ZST9_STYLE|nr:UNKNOWN [Stylonychia lemnae]|eukprot:CDW72947.1 UNKNOWN [Stylonychia lemnae]
MYIYITNFSSQQTQWHWPEQLPSNFTWRSTFKVKLQIQMRSSPAFVNQLRSSLIRILLVVFNSIGLQVYKQQQSLVERYTQTVLTNHQIHLGMQGKLCLEFLQDLALDQQTSIAPVVVLSHTALSLALATLLVLAWLGNSEDRHYMGEMIIFWFLVMVGLFMIWHLMYGLVA